MWSIGILIGKHKNKGFVGNASVFLYEKLKKKKKKDRGQCMRKISKFLKFLAKFKL